MAHLLVKQRSPLRNSFIASRRHSRQTDSRLRATGNQDLRRFRHCRSVLLPGPESRARFTDEEFRRIPGKRQTLRRFRGRQPLCGIGVASLMDRMSMPAAARARIALSRPAPGPFTRTSSERTPFSWAICAALPAASCAANGVPLREPLNPMRPAEDQARTLPCWSVIETIVLLKDACTVASACGMFFLSFLGPFFLPLAAEGFAAAVDSVGVAIITYFLVPFFFPATAPLRGPFRVRAFVWVRWPRTGRFRRCRTPR